MARRGALGAWDAICVTSGIVIGTAIFKTPDLIFPMFSHPGTAIGAWLAGGLLTLAGAFCYAELASTYPVSGGDYVFIRRAFGRFAGFMFGWAQLVAVLAGSIGAMAFVGAECLRHVVPAAGTLPVWSLAVGAVVLLAAVNVAGLEASRRVQRLLATVKVLGVLGIIAAGFRHGYVPAHFHGPALARPPGSATPSYTTALILVLYAYGGWNDVVMLTGDLHRPRRMVRVLVVCALGICTLYVLLNVALINGLGWQTVSSGVSDNLVVGLLGGASSRAAQLLSALILISALGAINGMMLAGSRIFVEMGMHHRAFSACALWSRRRRSPISALVLQTSAATALILAVGTATGRRLLNDRLASIGIATIPWTSFGNDGFATLFAGTAPVFWAFFLLSGLSLFPARRHDAQDPSCFRLRQPWFPLLPTGFCLTCVFGLWSSLNYAGWLGLLGLGLVGFGVPIYWLQDRLHGPDAADSTKRPAASDAAGRFAPKEAGKRSANLCRDRAAT